MSLLNKQGSLTLSLSPPLFLTVPTTCDAVDVFLCTVSSQRSVNEQQHSRYTHYAVHTHSEGNSVHVCHYKLEDILRTSTSIVMLIPQRC